MRCESQEGQTGMDGQCTLNSGQTGRCIPVAGSLNADPYNLRSEELAVAECARGVEVRRTWSEQEMVRGFGGNIFPGTPDGVFESWDGALTCVQVVRVPLIAGMNSFQMQETLQRIILTKVVKSQQWLRVCHVVPDDFVIFCWLPFVVPDAVVEDAHSLMERVRVLDPRFSLRLRVPAEPGALFPALFASVSQSRKMALPCRSVSESDVTAFTMCDDSSDQEDCLEWDLTWCWDSELPGLSGENQEGEEKVHSGGEESEDAEMEWDITWEWQAPIGDRSPSGGEGFCMLSKASCTYAGLCEGVAHGQRSEWDDGG